MFNKVILVGRLTADPELKTTQSNVSVTSFSIAVDRPYTPKGQERQVDFVDIVAWRQTAEFVCRYFSKGRAILVEGSLQSRTYVDKSGQNRRVWEVIADNARFVESKASSSGQARTEDYAPAPISEPAPSFSSGSVEDFAEIDDDDDGDLPF